jgi:hypothetical protein
VAVLDRPVDEAQPSLCPRRPRRLPEVGRAVADVAVPGASPHDDLRQERQLDGGPVMVTNTWTIHSRDLTEFLEVMDRLRVLRLRSGAYRWRLYRDAGDPHTMTEFFLVRSWDDHLRQHRRTDPLAARLIDRTRVLDRAGGPMTHHRVALEVADPARRPERIEQLVAASDGVHGRATPGRVPQ